MPDPQSRPLFRVTLEALPGGVPPAVRLRRALKVLLRAFGLRNRGVEVVAPEAAAPPTGQQGEEPHAR